MKVGWQVISGQEVSWNSFYEVKNKTLILIWKQEANIKVLHNSDSLMFDVKAMLTTFCTSNRKAVISLPKTHSVYYLLWCTMTWINTYKKVYYNQGVLLLLSTINIYKAILANSYQRSNIHKCCGQVVSSAHLRCWNWINLLAGITDDNMPSAVIPINRLIQLKEYHTGKIS